MSAPANDNRRETPLLGLLREEIATQGPLPVSRFMELCLRHPDYGYYTSQRAIGAEGDFITAPEISQIFGELIGLWCAVTWQTMGSPDALELVEIGPGRGTLMSDLLRAAGKVPGLCDALSVRLVEVSPVLQASQQARLAGCGIDVSWQATPDDAEPDRARIVIANEFLDTLPVAQYVKTDAGSFLRTVDCDAEGQLVFAADTAVPAPGPIAAQLESAVAGTVAEVPTHGFAFLDAIRRRDGGAPVAALFIDYGHEAAGTGETLQAVREHRFEHVLTSPGQADLSVQVDFAALAAAARSRGLAVQGPITQAEFLGQLGILERASRLMSANPAQAGEIEAGVLRLMAPNGMGTRFKAILLKSAGLGELPGFARPEPSEAPTGG